MTVIKLSEILLNRGEAELAQCPHCEEQSAFIPQIRKNSQGIFITHLLCAGPYCEGDGIVFPVVNGYLGNAQDE